MAVLENSTPSSYKACCQCTWIHGCDPGKLLTSQISTSIHFAYNLWSYSVIQRNLLLDSLALVNTLAGLQYFIVVTVVMQLHLGSFDIFHNFHLSIQIEYSLCFQSLKF